jgi:hypothetical protein
MKKFSLKSFTRFQCFIGLTTLFLILLSCGNKDKPPEDIYIIQATQTVCAEELKDILVRDISSALLCVREALDSYTTSVVREKKDYIQRRELTNFITEYFSDSAELATNLLKLVFELNTLLFNEPVDHLSISSYSRVFKLVSIINLQGLELKKILTGLSAKNYWLRRQDLYGRLQVMSNKILEMVTPFSRVNRQLNILDFIKNIKLILELSDEQINVESIKSYLFVKKLILGGEREVITINQVSDIFKRVPNMMTLALDALYSQDKIYANDEEQYFFYFDIIKELRSHMWKHTPVEEIFSHDDLSTVLKDFLNEEDNIPLVEKSIQTLKEKFIYGSSQSYTFADILKITDWLQEFSGMLYYNEVTFRYYKTKLNGPKAITWLRKPKLAEYNQLNQKYLNRYWKQFTTIVYKYRYYANKNGNSIYDKTYKRTEKGLNRISMFKWALEKVFTVYGVKSDQEKDLVASAKEINEVMQDGEGILKAFIYWPKEYDEFLNETVSNADLFQVQSNGNKLANAKELTEYLISVFHSFGISDRVYDVMKKNCPVIDAEDESFSVSCFRRHILKAFFDKLPLRNYYPRLYRYYKTASTEELSQYFKNIEIFARKDPQDHIPIAKEELTRLIVVISSIEAIYIKYDSNGNNILERAELDEAYYLFKGLIKDFIDLGDGDKKVYKSIFLYLIKYMKKPNAFQLFMFGLYPFKGSIKSTRFNIAAIINTIL